MAKDCTKRHRLPFRPNKSGTSSLQANAVEISTTVIRTAAIEEGITSGLYGMAVSLTDTPELDSLKRLVMAERTLALLRMAVPLPTDELGDPVYDPLGKDRCGNSIAWTTLS
jgi:hypothetical protein